MGVADPKSKILKLFSMTLLLHWFPQSTLTTFCLEDMKRKTKKDEKLSEVSGTVTSQMKHLPDTILNGDIEQKKQDIDKLFWGVVLHKDLCQI